MGKVINEAGNRYGRLSVVHVVDRGRPQRSWMCKCDCGGSIITDGYSLRAGYTKSCGCYRTEVISTAGGMANTKLHRIWHHMTHRCHNPKNDAYQYYGGRGISVCDRWRKSFLAFASDMGEPPEGTSLDRINNDGNYEPGNCRWANRIQQMQNTRKNVYLTKDGMTLCVSEWARSLGVNKAMLVHRIKLGWSHERILTEPSRRYRLQSALQS